MDPSLSMNLSSAASNHMDGQIESLKAMALNKSAKMSDRKMKEVASEFETMIFRQLLKEMRKTIPNNGFIERSHATEMYQEIADDHLAAQLAETNELGIGQMIYEELKEKNDQIAGPDDAKQEFKNLKQSSTEKDPDFIPLNTERDFIPLHQKPKMMELDRKENGYIPLGDRTRISTSKIDNS